MTRLKKHNRTDYTDESGFTMIAAIIVLFIGSLLLTAVFLGVNGDSKLTRTTLNGEKAYYAAQAGIANFQYHLNKQPEYWLTCPKGEGSVQQSAAESKTESTTETFSYQIVPASGTSYTACESKITASMIESTAPASGTFRLVSTGVSGGQTRSIVATFTHTGFLNYVYYTNYEDLDPSFYEHKLNCEQHYAARVKEAAERKISNDCKDIEFITGDEIKGPVHTNDAADICGKPVFGRNAEDKVEINGGTYTECGSNSPSYKGTFTEEGQEITPPPTDAELASSASSEYSFEGKTLITLHANLSEPEAANTMTVENAKINGGAPTTLQWPTSGVIYANNSSAGCGYTYSPFGSIYTTDGGCGNIYVHGEYTKSLTIGAANDIIINGNIKTDTSGSGAPNGAGTLGLIATNYVRIYHPVAQGYEPESYTPSTEAPITGTEKCGTLSTLSGVLKSGKSEVTGLSSTSKLSIGMEVNGSGIPLGTTISSIKNSTTIVLSKNATKSETTTLTFFKSSGFEYHSGQKLCVEAAKSGFTYNESETLDVKACESNTKSTGKDFCEYEISVKGCSSKATNLNAAEDPNKWGSLESPTIDAAILTTSHSFIVDNYTCGKPLGLLTIWGAIAQDFRGTVGTGNNATGYLKNYNYDSRLATDQPPNFINPTNVTWSVSRETQPPNICKAQSPAECNK